LSLETDCRLWIVSLCVEWRYCSLILLRQGWEFFLSHGRYDFSRASSVTSDHRRRDDWRHISSGWEPIGRVFKPCFAEVWEKKNARCMNWLRSAFDGNFWEGSVTEVLLGNKYRNMCRGLEPWWHYGLINNFQLVHISACIISRLCFFATDHFFTMGRWGMDAHLLL
jgi:hypothetical protein